MTEKELLKEFICILERHNCTYCSCGRKIDIGDLAWNTGYTDSGTEYSSIYIDCLKCDKELAYIQSWSGVSTLGDVIRALSTEW